MPDHPRNLKKVNVYLPPEIYEKVRDMAMSRGETISEFIRVIVESYFRWLIIVSETEKKYPTTTTQ